MFEDVPRVASTPAAASPTRSTSAPKGPCEIVVADEHVVPVGALFLDDDPGLVRCLSSASTVISEVDVKSVVLRICMWKRSRPLRIPAYSLPPEGENAAVTSPVPTGPLPGSTLRSDQLSPPSVEM